jgi:hypothetical protein
MQVNFLSPVPATAIGGVRMFYIQAEILNQSGVSSHVYHPEKPDYLCDWFDHSLTVRESANFSQSKDLMVVPEVWALSYGSLCMESKFRYAIFVQNGYLLGTSDLKPELEQKLRQVYHSADVIMTISVDVEKFLRLALPDLDPQKIVRCVPYISPGFVPLVKKKTISYMPRKLPRDAELICFLLKPYLPPDWSFVRIEKMTDAEVRKAMGESSIFMSFSFCEGLAAPPLEAAFAGNAVVGYTGGGGDEYFEEPIFTKVEYGDIHHFIKGVLSAVERCEAFASSEAVAQQRITLAERYGDVALRKNVQELALFLYRRLFYSGGSPQRGNSV